MHPDSAASREAARKLAATITPLSELEGQLVALLNDLADGGSFLVVKDEGEVTPAEAAVLLGVALPVDYVVVVELYFDPEAFFGVFA